MMDKDSRKFFLSRLYYFDGINEFKKLVHDLKEDLDAIMGETRIVFATRKGRSVGNTVVENRALCIEPNAESPNQKCNAGGCLQCPLVSNNSNLIINGKRKIIIIKLN